MSEVPVIIAGGGPVGLTLAMDLGWRGVPCLVFEERVPAMPPNPKCNTTNARSMEHFRRLGCADRIRATGLPADHPTHVLYLTRFNGHFLGRLNLPPSSMRRRDRGALDEGWPTPEPQHRISQIYLEPILYQHAQTFPGVEIRRGWRVEGFAQPDGHVEVEAVEVASGRRETHRARYMVGCDGGRSAIRRQLGIELRGIDVIGRTVSVYFRSPELIRHDRNGPAWMYWIVNRDLYATVVALDGKELWLCHLTVAPDKDFADVDIDRALAAALGVDVSRETLGVERWTSRRLVADHYRDGNVFLAGDAAHIWIPLGGFGMNAGIGDATNLAWMIAAAYHGWAGGNLLDAYEIERRPIGDLVSNAAVQIMKNRGPAMRVRDGLEDDSAEGEAIRREVGEAIVAADASQFNSVGVQLGYYYENSPINWNDGSAPPDFALDKYVPSSRPGARAPHLWLADGSSLYDRCGPEFTLLRLGDGRYDTRGIEAAAANRRVPLKVLDVREGSALAAYEGFPLIIVRPDQHVAWRGHNPPGDPMALIDRIRGSAD
ncbi:MAG TPA: FAD-dependent oxidoreductase [Candidatus Binataceae bacterium]|nr:FAD-dependent oxidoreductase [Candidatus Binataceae bacterium]